MKKVLVLCLTLMLVMVFSVTAIAAPNGFINSPTGQDGPELIEGKNENEDCEGEVIITPYSEKDKLDDDNEDDMDKAYDSITSADDLGDLNADLDSIAKELGVDTEDLAVSDLFHIDFDCDDHEGHGLFEITIKPETLKNYAGLMYFDGEKWVMVDATIKGDKLSFDLENPGPMAIVVNAGSSSVNAPQTGDAFPWVYVALIAVCAAGLVVVLVRLKKKEA